MYQHEFTPCCRRNSRARAHASASVGRQSRSWSSPSGRSSSPAQGTLTISHPRGGRPESANMESSRYLRGMPPAAPVVAQSASGCQPQRQKLPPAAPEAAQSARPQRQWLPTAAPVAANRSEPQRQWLLHPAAPVAANRNASACQPQRRPLQARRRRDGSPPSRKGAAVR